VPPALLDLKGRPLNDFSYVKPWDRGAFLRSVKGATLQETVMIEETPVRLLSAPVYRKGKRAWVVQLIRPLDEMEQLLRNLDRTLLLLALPALILAGISGAFLTERNLRPVRRISLAASKLGTQDLSLRLPVKGKDEFSELASNFNRMTARLEEAFGGLGAAYRTLESAYERQRRFTADASHELRTPLTTIKANTSLALSGAANVNSYREALEEADAAANTMNRIVDDLLFLARSDSDGLRVEMKPVPVRRIIEETLAPYGGRRGDPPVTVSLPDPDLQLTGDAHHLKRLLMNLVENAVRHTPPGGSVEVSAERVGESVILKVEDTGDGIAAEHLPHVFDRFYRADDARSRDEGGAGLGLSICQGIVRAHDGTIAIDSRQGEGTIVTVSLPFGSAAGTDQASEHPMSL
jgi:heavy metal sensor kinase